MTFTGPGSTNAQIAMPASVEVPRTYRHISINGDLSEWDSAAVISFHSPYGCGERDNSATVKLLWDNDKLYVAFIVEDTELMGSHLTDGDDVWKDDAVEILVDSRRNADDVLKLSDEEFEKRGGLIEERTRERKYLAPDDYHFIVNLRGSVSRASGDQLDYHDESGADQLIRAVALSGTVNNRADIDTQYVVEAAIPWASMHVRPRGGLTIGADFGVEDVDSDGRHCFDWCDAGSLHKPYLWGEVVLAGGGVGFGRSRAVSWAVGGIAAAVLALLLGLGWVGRSRNVAAGAADSGRAAEIAVRIEDYIISNSLSPTLSPSKAGRDLGISSRYLSKVLRKQGKPTFRALLFRERISKAREMLLKTDMGMAEIASAAGFASQSSFSKHFRRETGYPPSEFRKHRFEAS